MEYSPRNKDLYRIGNLVKFDNGLGDIYLGVIVTLFGKYGNFVEINWSTPMPGNLDERVWVMGGDKNLKVVG